jgi:hypothetical protein
MRFSRSLALFQFTLRTKWSGKLFDKNTPCVRLLGKAAVSRHRDNEAGGEAAVSVLTPEIRRKLASVSTVALTSPLFKRGLCNHFLCPPTLQETVDKYKAWRARNGL